MSARHQRLAAIHMGKKALGLDEETYRDLLESAAGVRSAADATEDGLIKILKRMQDAGFDQRPRRDFGRRPNLPQRDKSELVKKIEALLADDGKHWNYALGMARKMFGKESIEFCSPAELYKIVAALEYAKKRREKKHATTD